MKTYKVTITETLQLTAEVEAPTRSEARDIVERRYRDSEYILDADHFKGVTFTMPRTRDYER